MSDFRPYPKSSQLARGERRYRRKVASAKQWQRIIAAKDGPSRVPPAYELTRDCMACNREPGFPVCSLCSRIEDAARENGTPSPQLLALPVEFHHLVPRDLGGDDTADNIVPLTRPAHRRVTEREPVALATLKASLLDPERAYIVGKLGEGGIERLFGTGRSCSQETVHGPHEWNEGHCPGVPLVAAATVHRA